MNQFKQTISFFLILTFLATNASAGILPCLTPSYPLTLNVVQTTHQADDKAQTWQTITMTYDILNKLKTITDPLGRLTTYNYDA